MRLKTIVGWGTLIALVAISVVAIDLWSKHRSRYLREAEARLGIDDRTGAIDALQNHLMSFPDDGRTRTRLAKLIAEEGNRESAIRLYSVALEQLRSEYPDSSWLLFHVASEFSELLDYRADELEQNIDLCIEDSAFSTALAICDTLVQVRSDSPYLNEFAVRQMWEDTSIVGLYLRVATEDCARARAFEALIHWYMGASNPAHLLVGGECEVFSITPQFNSSGSSTLQTRLLTLSDLLSERAESAFDDHEFAFSSRAFTSAATFRRMGRDSPDDAEASRLRFNSALSLYHLGKLSEAKRGFSELLVESPGYIHEEVTRMIRACESSALWQGYDRLRGRATALFEKESWDNAAMAYERTAKYLCSNAHAISDELVAECRYNQAMAYWNGDRFLEAESLLIELQTDSPNYEPTLVKEQISKVMGERLLDRRTLIDRVFPDGR